jgi:P4 family phage/plasmid primase-like protien
MIQQMEDNILYVFENFLNDHRVNKNKTPNAIITHTGMGNNMLGSFSITGTDYDKFNRYYKMMVNEGYPCSIVEQHQGKRVGPVIIDIDFRTTQSERCYTQEHIKKIIQIYNDVIESLFEIFNNDTLNTYILEKDDPTREEKKDGVTYKDGFHIVYPYLPLKVEYRYLLYKQTLEKIISEKVFDDINHINDITDVCDRSVLYANGVLMFGSSKPNRTPYKLTTIYDSKINSIDNNLDTSSIIDLCLLRSYDLNDSLYLIDDKEDITSRKIAKKEFNYKFINADDDTEVNDNEFDIDDKEKEKNEKVIHQPNYNKNNMGNIVYSKICECCSKPIPQITLNLEQRLIVEELVEILSDKRAEAFGTWVNIGWTLHNIWHGFLPLFIKFSKRSSKYEAGCCEKIWREAKTTGYNLPSLKIWAKEDNPRKFKEIINKHLEKLVAIASSGTHYDIAKVIHQMYEGQFVCVDIKRNIWYEFQSPRWIMIQDGYTLSEKISSDFTSQIHAIIQAKKTAIIDENKEDKEEDSQTQHLNNEKDVENFKKMFELNKNLKTVSFKSSVLKECSHKFYDNKFVEKLNAIPHLIGFENGVFDLKTQIFRQGVPEDYITFSTGYAYEEFDDEYIYVKEVLEYFAKVQTDPEVREYLLRTILSFIDASIKNQSFTFWPGSGANGKSTTIELIVKAFNDYAGTIPTKILTGPTPDASTPTHGLADKPGKRFVSANETGVNETLNIATMKLLSGGDKIAVRPMYGDMFYFTPLFKMILACNNLPIIPSLDGGTWRRIIKLDFGSKFVDTPDPNKPNEFKRDNELNEKFDLWKSAFMWVLLRRILPKYLKDEAKKKGLGLKIPEKVRLDTEAYRSESDTIYHFIKDNYITYKQDKSIEDHSEKIESVYEIYKDWYKGSYGQKPISKKEFEKYFMDSSEYKISKKEIQGIKFDTKID